MRIIASILLILAIASNAFGQGSQSDCSYNDVNYGSLSNGSYSQLSAASGSNPAGKYRFFWNICGVASKCSISGASACQLTVGGTAKATSVGSLSLGKWSTTNGLPTLTYTTDSAPCNGDIFRTIDIKLKCDSKVNPTQAAAVVEESKCVYGVTMTGSDLCGGGSNGSGNNNNNGNGSQQPSKGGIGGGWIFIIILLSVTVVYIVGGIIFNAKVKHQHGSDMFPNKEMWVNFGGLIKDGVFFIKSKVTGSQQGYQQV
ncbi:hypothetical protein RB653_003922 [Dictyostelium firmibasis]|uniref:Autophagy-related protein 27 n=1 Tax=Dictyostelium firmibasis TaxID=79012 RepID=A0AAN7TYK8_9MYCE